MAVDDRQLDRLEPTPAQQVEMRAVAPPQGQRDQQEQQAIQGLQAQRDQ
jgi:hypothetical protein